MGWTSATVAGIVTETGAGAGAARVAVTAVGHGGSGVEVQAVSVTSSDNSKTVPCGVRGRAESAANRGAVICGERAVRVMIVARVWNRPRLAQVRGVRHYPASHLWPVVLRCLQWVFA